MIKVRVREVAEQKGLNLSQLQRKCDTPMGSVRRYWYAAVGGKEKGKPLRSVDLDVLERLAKALEVNYCELLVDEPPEEEL